MKLLLRQLLNLNKPIQRTENGIKVTEHFPGESKIPGWYISLMKKIGERMKTSKKKEPDDILCSIFIDHIDQLHSHIDLVDDEQLRQILTTATDDVRMDLAEMLTLLMLSSREYKDPKQELEVKKLIQDFLDRSYV